MAQTRDQKLLALTRKQNRVIDDAAGELRGAIERAIAKALPVVQSWLSGRLHVVADIVEPTKQTQATLRLLMRQINTQTLKRAKLDQAIEAWSLTFGRQMPLFDETLKLMGLPAMDWSAPDRAWLANSILSAQEQVKGVIESAARVVQEQALYSFGSLKLSRLYELMQARMAMAPAQAVNVADTSATVFLRSVHERGYARIEETQSAPLRYRFYGPDDKLERPFCHALHTGRGIDRHDGKRHLFAPASTAADASYTRDDIGKMSNGQLPNVMLTGGGYRCRHQWIVASLVPAPAAEEKPKVDARSAPEVREQLARKDAEIEKRIAELSRDLASLSRRMAAEVADPAGKQDRFEALNAEFASAMAERGKLILGKPQALREVLYGPESGHATIRLSARAPEELRRVVAEAEVFISRLLGVALGEVKATFRAGARAHYKQANKVGSMLLGKDEDVETVVHEAGHWIEHLFPAVHDAAVAFLRRRTTLPDGTREAPRPLRYLTGTRGYKNTETARPDKFDDPYVGKMYRGEIATEVVSMGIQSLWKDAVGFSKRDTDYFDSLWEIIRQAGTKVP